MEKGISICLVPRKEAGLEKKSEHLATYPAPLGYRKPGKLEEFCVARAWSTKDEKGRDGTWREKIITNIPNRATRLRLILRRRGITEGC